jgi:hypothetical protein
MNREVMRELVDRIREQVGSYLAELATHEDDHMLVATIVVMFDECVRQCLRKGMSKPEILDVVAEHIDEIERLNRSAN